MLPELPSDGQQVQVSGEDRRRLVLQTVAGSDERPVERAAVVRHEPRLRRELPGQGREKRRFVGMVGQHELPDAELVLLPAAHAHEEGERPGTRPEPRRLGVQAHQWARQVDGVGEPRQALRVERQAAAPIDDDRRPCGRLLDTSPEGRGEALRPSWTGTAGRALGRRAAPGTQAASAAETIEASPTDTGHRVDHRPRLTSSCASSSVTGA